MVIAKSGEEIQERLDDLCHKEKELKRYKRALELAISYIDELCPESEGCREIDNPNCKECNVNYLLQQADKELNDAT